MNKLLLGAYIAYFCGLSAAKIGDMPKPSTDPYSWWLPLAFLLLMAIPAYLGFEIGKERHEPQSGETK